MYQSMQRLTDSGMELFESGCVGVGVWVCVCGCVGVSVDRRGEEGVEVSRE